MESLMTALKVARLVEKVANATQQPTTTSLLGTLSQTNVGSPHTTHASVVRLLPLLDHHLHILSPPPSLTSRHLHAYSLTNL